MVLCARGPCGRYGCEVLNGLHVRYGHVSSVYPIPLYSSRKNANVFLGKNAQITKTQYGKIA
jgi:hypothetical protein